MPNKIYLKSENGIPFYNGTSYNYTGIGVNFNSGGLFAAVRNTEDSKGGFLEASLSKKLNSGFSLGSKTRYIFSKQNNTLNQNITERVSLNYSTKHKNFNFYEIIGVNTNFSVNNGEFKSIAPIFYSGVEYQISDNAKIYGELEVAKGYDLTKGWNKASHAINFGTVIDI